MRREISLCPWLVGIIGLVLSGMVGFGCAPVKPQLPLDADSTQFVLQTLRERESHIKAIKGLFQASITGPVLPISQNLNGVLFYRRPYAVQLRGFTRIGGVIFEFIRDTDHYELRLPSAGKFVTGRITELDKAQEFSQIVELSLRAMDAILGNIEGMATDDVALYDDGERIRLEGDLIKQYVTGSEEPLSTRIWMNRDTFDVMQVEYVTEDDDVAISVTCSDFRLVERNTTDSVRALRLPFHIRAEDFRSSGGSMTLKFQELVANANSSGV